jgi:hypothetical protein
MTDIEADRLFDSMLSKVERRLERALLSNFINLSRVVRSVIENNGTLGAQVVISQNSQEIEKILMQSYEESIREGVRFTRRDLDLPIEEDEDNFNEALLLLLLWRTDTARTHAEQLTNTTLNLLTQFDTEARLLGLSQDDTAKFIASELMKRNRGRLRGISTTEAGEALSAGSEAQGDIINEQLVKSWRSQRDTIVRDSHRRADQRYTAEPILLDENFQVGAGSGPYPRSSQLPLSERAGCRCYIRHKRVSV